MNEALNILTKFNWFLKPVSDSIIFLFTTKSGFWILISGFLLYLFVPIIDNLRVRSLEKRAAYGNANLSFVERMYIIIKTLSKKSLQIFTQIPVILVIITLMTFVTGLSAGLSTIEEFVENEIKIKEMETVLKQLDDSYLVADVTINDYDPVTQITNLTIKYFNSEIDDFEPGSQTINIKGDDIYFDAIVLNFEYSNIINDSKRNLVLPLKIFSNLIAQNDGIPLNIFNKEGIPYIYKRKHENIYMVSDEKYNQYIKIFSDYAIDKNKAKDAGIRSMNANAVHKKVKSGKVFSILIQQFRNKNKIKNLQ